MIDQTIAHYRILSKLGEGGMGIVYKAEDLKLGRIVALKFLPSEAAGERERFLREARAAAALNHPNICTIHEIDEDRGFIAMEYLEGPSVQGKIAARPLPMDEAIRIATETCAGLQAAHEKGIIHRDIKPANLMLTGAGQVKIMDFGLALLDGVSRITKAGASPGTPAYMSPEQTQGHAAGRRSDIWAVGVVLYQMLTGRLPFSGESDLAVSYGIVNSQPEPVTAMRSGLPVDVDRVVLKALAKSPEERYQTAADLIVDLRSLAGTPRVPAARANLGRWIAIAAGLLLLAAVSVLAWRTMTPARKIQSIAILPLRPLSAESADSLLGLGIADALITKIGQTGLLQVRPVSAIRKYAKEDADPLEAAGKLDVESILAGTLQQAGKRIRVSVQLLLAKSGETLWAQTFEVPSGDVFAVQDEIARQVAGQLNLKLDAAQQREFEKRSTANTEAFEYYSKALYHLSRRTRYGETEIAIELAKKAVELDPSYADARALLGYVYTNHGVYIVDDHKFVELGEHHLREAEKLDPRNALIHEARGMTLFSRFGGWKLREAIQEGLAANRLNPNAGHRELAYFYWHIGLEDLGAKHSAAAIRANPEDPYQKESLPDYFYMSLLADEGAAREKELFRRSPNIQYYLIKEMVKEAAELIEKEYAINPEKRVTHRTLRPTIFRAKLYAIQGKANDVRREADAIEKLVEGAPQTQPYHHMTYSLAQIRSRIGDAPGALRWLKITVDTGWPNYPMMARDRMLDPVRNDPAVAAFLNALKATWESNRDEFGGARRP